jgi:hypothetical protein
MSEPTALQHLVSDEQAEELLDDLRDLDGLVPEDSNLPAVEGWELAIEFDINDVPLMVEELEEVVNGDV